MRMPCLVATVALLVSTAPARAAELDPFLPADTQSYLSINVRQIIDAPVFKKQLLGPSRDAIREVGGGELSRVLEDLGIDLFRDIDRLTIVSPGNNEADRGLIIVHGTLDPTRFKTRAERAVRDSPEAMKLHKVPLGGGASHDVLEVVVPNQDLSLFVAVANNKALLASPGKDYVVDALKQARAKKKPSLKNREFEALLEKLDSRQSLSLAVLGKSLAKVENEFVPKFVTEALGGVEAIGGGVTISNEVRFELLMASKDAEAAHRMQQALDRVVKLALVGLSLLGEERKELGLVLEVFKTVRVSSKGKVVAVKAALTQDVIDDFFKKDG